MGAGQRVFFAMQAVMFAVSAGTTALVARAWGAGDHKEASRVTMASLTLGCLLAFFVMLVGVTLARPIAGLFGLDPDTLDLAEANIRMLSWFNVAFAVTFILSAALRAAGDAWSPLWIGFGINMLNLPLLHGLVFGRYGLPAMGVAGAAAAGGVSFSVGALLLLSLWLKQKFRVPHMRGGWWRRERLRRLLDIGYPAALEQLVFQVGFFIFLMLIGNFYGTEAFAAYNVGANLLMVCITVGFGFSIAGATLVGQNLGAENPQGAVRAGWRACAWAVLSMGGLSLAVIVFAGDLAVYFLGGAVDHRVHDGFHPCAGRGHALAGGGVRLGRRPARRRGHPLSPHGDLLGPHRHALRTGGPVHLPRSAGGLGLCCADRRLRPEGGAPSAAFSPGQVENRGAHCPASRLTASAHR